MIFINKKAFIIAKIVIFVLLESYICFRVIGLVESYAYDEFGKLYLL